MAGTLELMDAAELAEWGELFEAISLDPLYRRLQRFGNLPLFRVHRQRYAGAPRNAPCPCGAGVKFKKCHGR